MANTSRGPRGRFVKTDETAQRSAEAARLRSRGYTYQRIADELDYADPTGARRAVERALAAVVTESADELRALQLAQLDDLTLQALGVLERQHITVSHGRIIRGDNDEPIEDDGPVLQAIDRLLRIQERRAKLLGLDAPSKVEVYPLDAIDAEIRRLSAELGRGAADETAGAAGASGGR